MYAIEPGKLANARQVSKALTQARLAWTGLPGFPGELPTSLEEAYAIQSLSINAWPEPVAGWKVGGIPPQFQHFGACSLAGPIFPSNVFYDDGSRHPMFAVANGFAAVEGEIVIKTAIDLNPGMFQTLPLQDMIASVHIGVEVASSPVLLINEIGPMCVICDFGNNAGQIIGREIEDWQSYDFNDVIVTVDINGKQVGKKAVGPLDQGPLAAFAFLVKLCSDRSMVLPAGSYITTGAVSGVHETQIGARSTVDFGKLGAIDIELITATP